MQMLLIELLLFKCEGFQCQKVVAGLLFLGLTSIRRSPTKILLGRKKKKRGKTRYSRAFPLYHAVLTEIHVGFLPSKSSINNRKAKRRPSSVICLQNTLVVFFRKLTNHGKC